MGSFVVWREFWCREQTSVCLIEAVVKEDDGLRRAQRQAPVPSNPVSRGELQTNRGSTQVALKLETACRGLGVSFDNDDLEFLM